jgi:hypothetical protein
VEILSPGEQLAAFVLGAFALLVVGAMAWSLLSWRRRRAGFEEAADALGFSPADPGVLLRGDVRRLTELRPALPGGGGRGRFDNLVHRQEGPVRIFLFDFALGSTAGDALLPQGTFVCFVEAGNELPAVRIVPRPAPEAPRGLRDRAGSELSRLELVDPAPPAFTRRYVVEGHGEEARSFLTAARLDALAGAEPPWLVEAVGDCLLLARRPGLAGLRRFDHPAPSDLGALLEEARRLYPVLKGR